MAHTEPPSGQLPSLMSEFLDFAHSEEQDFPEADQTQPLQTTPNDNQDAAISSDLTPDDTEPSAGQQLLSLMSEYPDLADSEEQGFSEADQTQPLQTTPNDNQDAQLKAFDDSVGDADSARRFIAGTGGEGRDPTRVINDDWQTCAASAQQHATRLLSALQMRPDAPSSELPDEVREWLEERQDVVYKQVLDAFSTPLLVKVASALSTLAVDEVIKLHQYGSKKAELMNRQSSRGYKVDKSFTCSKRLDFMINAAKENKNIARDVLAGVGVYDFAIDPKNYLRRKIYNSKGNWSKKLVMNNAKSEASEPKPIRKSLKRQRDDDLGDE